MAAGGGGAAKMSVAELMDAVDFYAFRMRYRHIYDLCNDFVAQHGRHDVAQFWRGFALAMEGSYTEAVRELDQLRGKRELALPVIAALITTHSKCEVKDREAIVALKEQLKDESASNSEDELLLAARYFIHSQKAKQARKCLEKVYARNKQNRDALLLMGWLALGDASEKQQKASLALFEAVLGLRQSKELGPLLGCAAYYEKQGNYVRSLEFINQVIVGFPVFDAGLTEKARLLLIMENWDEAVEEASRALRKNPLSIDALQVLVLQLMVRESKPNAAMARCQELMAAMEKLEPRNALLFFHASRLVSRLASRRPGILRLSLKMIVRACKLQPGASSFVAEQAYQHLLLGDFDIAAELFSEASKSEADQESENLSALCGFIRCKIMQNQFAQAQEQLEFVSTLPELSAKNPELLLLSSMVAWRKANDEARALQLLGDAIDEHRKKVVNLPPGWDLFTVYNPDFVLELATELMAHVSSEPLEAHDPPNPLLDRAAQLLAELARRVPGMIGAWLLLAKVHYVAGRLDDADRALATCVRLDGQFADVYLVQAQVSVARKSYAQAAQALEQALGLSFEVRNTPLYHFIRGRVLNQTGKPQEALKLLEAGMALPGVKRASQSHIVSVQDRISLFLELARTHAALNHLPEAAKVMNDARFEFEKCQEFARVQIAEADLALMRRDVDSAVNTLRSVPSHNPYFTRAKIRLADVYLKLRRNKRMYLGCFEDLASHSPSAHMHVLLGEAALRAQEPERAIRAFEEALALDKDNAVVRSLIGRALVATHDYARAVNYYESALAADRTKVILAHELAELYLQLKQFPKATQVLATTAGVLEAKRSESGGEDAVALRELVTTRTLLARVSEASNGSASEAENHLKEALKVQIELLSALRARDADALQKERAVAADLCYKLARLFQSRLLDNGKALQFYNEALQHHDTHLESMFALARLHLAMGDLDAYQSVCRSMRAAFPDHLEVSMMLADVMFRKGEYDAATFHFKQLLEKNPCHYEALARLVMLLRRAGNLGDALRFFTLAERASTKAQYDAGFNYCKGLFHRFSNQPREALKHFNQARKDGVWAREALYHMVEIYLLPDNASLFQESTEAKGNANEHVSAAENLLKELRQWGETENSKRYSLLMCYAAMMTRLKERVEFALTTAADILSNDRDNPAALLAMANAFALQKQETKARNQLKRIAKLNFDPSYAEEFERGWLMLADVYVQLGKFDLAQELCKKALANNRSCAKAWELMGVMMEKEQSYQDAADKYERAWKLLNESSSAVGYKLAFNYLKARRLVEAISVCHKVLDAFPDYPRIRKDILDKAREGLRP